MLQRNERTVFARRPLIFVEPGSTPYKKQGNHRKSYMVIDENIKGIESTREVYGNMQVIKRPSYSIIPCKSYTVP